MCVRHHRPSVRREGRALQHPVANRLHAAVALLLPAELAHREPVQAIRLTVAARAEVAQHLRGQARDCNLRDPGRLGDVVQQVTVALYASLSGPGKACTRR